MPTHTFIAAIPTEHLMARLRALLDVAGESLFDLLLALAVALAGWAVGALAARLTRALLRALRFDAGVRALFGGGGSPRAEPSALGAWAVYWLVTGIGLLLALDTLGFDLLTPVGDRLREVLPRVVVSGVLLVVGVLAAMLLGALTRRLFESGGLAGGKLRGRVVAAVLTGFAVLIALEQLGLAAQFVMGIGLLAVGATGLGLALAFGLGCRELARDFLVEYLRSLDDDRPSRPA